MFVSFGIFRLKARERQLIGPAGPIELSTRSFDILAAILDRPGELVEKSYLLETVWPGTIVEENTLHVHVSALRKALGAGYLATVHGRGYRYAGPPPRREDEPSELPRPDLRSGNLGRYRVDCVARDVERDAVAALLARQPLVSVLGPGGVGKTTLALAVAAQIAGDFSAGVWVIDLAAIADAALVESAIVQTLGIPFRPGVALLRSIVDEIGNRHLLLVLDNCEHVAVAVAAFARAMLADAPNLKILATTQVPLGLPREHLFKLAPFHLPEAGSDSDTAASARFLAHCYEALGESFTPAELPVVARLCRRLDGVALALKMAAARAATLGIEAVDRQIAQHLAGLTAEWDPSLPRHRSLAASLGWSYALLADQDRLTLRSTGVFQGSFTLDAIRAIVGAGADASLSELVRRSLVVRDGLDRSRYRLLETTRHFALEQLAASGEEREARNRHAAFFLAHFTDALAQWETVPDPDWQARYRPDGDNLRAALDWSYSQLDWPIHVGLAACACRFWIETYLPDEALRRCEAALLHADQAPPPIAAALRLAFAEITRFHRQDWRARQELPAAIAWFERAGDLHHLAHAVLLDGMTLTVQQKPVDASVAFNRLDALTARMPPSKLKARALVTTGIDIWAQGDKNVGLAKVDAGIAMQMALGNQRGRFKSHMYTAEILHRDGDNDRAIALGYAILPSLREEGTAEELGGQLDNLAAYLLAADRPDEAEPLLLEAAAILPHDNGNGHWCLLQNAAELASLRGQLETAALLLAFTDRGFASWADGRQATEVMQRGRIVARLAKGLAAADRDRLATRGGAVSAFEADRLAGFVDTGVAGP
jgi:predicted ATPase/DNA-binding winged helix-turn-helix (wHTH) protein